MDLQASQWATFLGLGALPALADAACKVMAIASADMSRFLRTGKDNVMRTLPAGHLQAARRGYLDRRSKRTERPSFVKGGLAVSVCPETY
jgi:hypothetical protein